MKTEIIKQKFLNSVEANTPEEIKNQPIFDLDKKTAFEIKITAELVKKWHLEEWLANYKKEARASTAGIRGAQNVLYPWDVRFPINELGIALATLAKALVLKAKSNNRKLQKIAAGEVRFNTPAYIDLIARIQAALSITTHVTLKYQTTPVWLVSFLIFMLDYDGGEYLTASHSVATKTATKDLDNQGSQFLPEDSLSFVAKIEEIVNQAKNSPSGYVLRLAAKRDSLIKPDVSGIDLYIDYLKNGVATDSNLQLIQGQSKQGFRVMFDCVGGSMAKVMQSLLVKLKIKSAFEFIRQTEDSFQCGIGKDWRIDPKSGQLGFFDLSCDASILDVVKTMGYEQILKQKPIGYAVLITDPDGDRLILGQVEPNSRQEALRKLGVDFININADKIFSVYHPTYGFLLMMDFYCQQLKKAGIFNNYPRVMIKTTASSQAWDEWAKFNNIKIVNTPVGFKEVAAVMKKIEKQMVNQPPNDVVIKDIFGQKINLGKNPRLIFGGEESGGMIIGPEKLIQSRGGRIALAMREKSVGEAAIVAASMAASLYQQKKLFSEYLAEIFDQNKISSRYYWRIDQTYYNESELNPEILKQTKKDGEVVRDKIYNFYLSLCFALKQKIIILDQMKNILSEVLGVVDLSNLQDVIFVGDGIYFQFNQMFIEVRKSGTDAKSRFYVCGADQKICQVMIKKIASYTGQHSALYAKLIPSSFTQEAIKLADEFYGSYFRQGF